MKHRNDIDGLRALAVLPVVAYHAFPKLVPGGYVGVDVFFVISGFLITSIIHREVGEGIFSILRFYERRARRIVPALVAMVAVCAIAAWYWLYPYDFHEFGRSVAGAMLFSSNFFFWWRTDYFSPVAESQPLLHTWSLAVEEQFYILFPLLLMALKGRSQRTVILWLAGLAVASFVLATVQVRHTASDAFYLLPGRAWELLAGSLLAVMGPSLKETRPILRESLAGLGALLILAVIFVYRPTTPFPGPTALAPVAGAVLILAFAPGTLVGRLLSFKLAVWVGLISYSLYLWHWPALVFGREAFGATRLVTVSAVLTAFVAAYLSWRFVEQPFRRGFRWPSARLVGLSAAVLTSVAGLGLAISIASPSVQRFPAEAVRMASFLDYRNTPAYTTQFRRDICFISGRTGRPEQFDDKVCLSGDSRPKVLVFGDSHAAHLWYGIKSQLPQYNVLQATYSGCKPTHPTHGDAGCTGFVQRMYARIASPERPDLVVLSARWTQADAPALAETMRYLTDQHVRYVVLGPIVEYKRDLPWLLAEEQVKGQSSLAAHQRKSSAETDAVLRHLAVEHHADYISVYDIVCPQGRCIESLGGEPLQFDYGHLTMQGSVFVAGQIAPTLARDITAGATTAQLQGNRSGPGDEGLQSTVVSSAKTPTLAAVSGQPGSRTLR